MKVVVVAITDGRANVPLAVSMKEEDLTPELQKDKAALKVPIQPIVAMGCAGIASGYVLLQLVLFLFHSRA